jgi:hypothetical protein
MLITESVCILIGTLSLATGYYQFRLPVVAIGWIVLGLVWLLSRWGRWAWMASIGLFVCVCAAGVGVGIGLSPVLMAVSVLGSLFAWDLADFSRRLQRAAPEDDLRQLQQLHLLRLAALGGISLALYLAATFIHLVISFGWLFLLALAAVLGLVETARRLRKAG